MALIQGKFVHDQAAYISPLELTMPALRKARVIDLLDGVPVQTVNWATWLIGKSCVRASTQAQRDGV